MKIIVETEEEKEELLKESEYIHWLDNINSDKAGTFMHIYLNPSMIEVVPIDTANSISKEQCVKTCLFKGLIS